MRISESVWNILICPHCSNQLQQSNNGAVCKSCQINYLFTQSGSLDVRLKKTRIYHFPFALGKPLISDSNFEFNLLTKNEYPEVDFSDFKVPNHLSDILMSYFPKARSSNSLMLDLGCGNTVHQNVCEKAGFEYVGLDYTSLEAPLLGDAHALPFRDASFEFILTIAVLEHLRFLFVAMKEAYRVLKPGGTFIGTVAFLEPFHGNSYYHHTHLGTYNSISEAGFSIEIVSPSSDWTVLQAQARMGLFPKLPDFLSKLLVMPVYIIHKLWFIVGYAITKNDLASEKNRLINTTGSFTFVARKK